MSESETYPTPPTAFNVDAATERWNDAAREASEYVDQPYKGRVRRVIQAIAEQMAAERMTLVVNPKYTDKELEEARALVTGLRSGPAEAIYHPEVRGEALEPQEPHPLIPPEVWLEEVRAAWRENAAQQREPSPQEPTGRDAADMGR